MKTRVAVIFGGRSPEHDVSIATGFQALHAVDQQRFTAFPAYISPSGEWYLGDSLRRQENYIPSASALAELEPVSLDVWPNAEGVGRFLSRRPSKLLSRPKVTEFDVALLALHGLFGEDGAIQGLLETANVPYTGARLMASAIFMDKAATKRALHNTGVSVLPHATIHRPPSGLMLNDEEIEKQIGSQHFPVIVKPMHLGSSIGVVRASTASEIRSALPAIFKLDDQAIVEPFVENLVEYNIAVCRSQGGILTSAVERPKRTQELLDFRTKYMSGPQESRGRKRPGEMQPGLLALTREIRPSIDDALLHKIRDWATVCFELMAGTGAPRVDFLSNGKTGELWLNEVNPCPGSFGYFLWEAADMPILFPQLLSALIDEAFACQRARRLPDDPTPPDARLFPRS